MSTKPTVLFVCVHNAGRSQMAAGYLQVLAGDRIDVLSAGSEPKDQINPVAVDAMAEEGIDIANNVPKLLTVDAVKESDVVITTALIPGKRAPILITTEMVEAMQPGSVVVDLAAERGGNCEVTRPDERVVHRGVTVLGPTNPASLVPYHASQMYSKNVITFLLHLLGKEGAKQPKLTIDVSDEITRETLLTHDGAVVHPRVRELIG